MAWPLSTVREGAQLADCITGPVVWHAVAAGKWLSWSIQDNASQSPTRYETNLEKTLLSQSDLALPNQQFLVFLINSNSDKNRQETKNSLRKRVCQWSQNPVPTISS